jgi:Arc/MetJ-type ribon-helix-helix transcriptional regulator
MALTIHLPPHLRDQVARDVEAGRFESEEAAIIDALELAYERIAWDEDPELLAAIEEADRGEGELWTPDLMNEIVDEALENSRRGYQVPDDIKY